MKLIKISFGVFFVFFFISSCKVTDQHYYIPAENNNIRLTERNDLKVSGTVSFSEASIGNFQIGYSPIKHLGIVGSYLDQRNSSNAYPLSYKDGDILNVMTYQDIAIGGYFFKKKENNLSSWIPKKWLEESGWGIDFYVGIGSGDIFRDYISFSSDATFHFNKSFAQLGLHYRFHGLGVSYSFSYGKLNYDKLEVYANPFRLPLGVFDELINDNNPNSFEGTLRVEYGMRFGKINLNYTTYRQNINFVDDLKRAYTSIGIVVDIDEFFRKKGRLE